ncbi:hypothetical protein ARTHRO9AX_210176 [Arthrobacter sp. 9AX]|nr:hypothetical protein ARTHRO9AX_210176 [Arthrobacter sp. 9AX]
MDWGLSTQFSEQCATCRASAEKRRCHWPELYILLDIGLAAGRWKVRRIQRLQPPAAPPGGRCVSPARFDLSEWH